MNLADPSSSSSQPLPVSSVPLQLSLYEPEESEQEMIIAEEIVVCSESEDSASDASFCKL